MMWILLMVADAAVLDVGVGQPYATMNDALVGAIDGDEIVVHDAVVAEELVVVGLELSIRSASRTTWLPAPGSVAPLSVRSGSAVTVRGFDFVDTATAVVWEIDVDNASLDVRDSTFEGAGIESLVAGAIDVRRCGFRGSRIVVDGGTLLVRGSTFEDGSAVDVDASTVVIETSVFRRLGTGVRALNGSTVVVDRSMFLQHSEQTILSLDGDLEVSDSVFADNHSTPGRYYFGCERGSCTVRDSVFVGNVSSATSQGIWFGGDLLLERNRFCRNEATVGPISLIGATGTVRNNAFIENVADAWSAGLTVMGGDLRIEHNTFLGNSSPQHAITFDATTAELVGNLVTENDTALGASTSLGGSVASEYGAWYDNLGGDATWALGATDLVGVDPMLAGTGGACSWARITPLPGSPLIDGNPTLLDPDGTAADIGATGGPHAP